MENAKLDISNDNEVGDAREVSFPDRPERPEESDCCGSGCSPCVFDVYEEKLRKWEGIRRDNPGGWEREGGESYLSDTRYKAFIVEGVVTHTHDTKVFTFRAEGEGELGIRPGQHVIMRGEGVSRAYTPISSRPGAFEVLARIYPQGRMSAILSCLSPGDVAHFRGPYGCTPSHRTYRRVLMLSAGTGIAPAYALARSIVADQSDETFVRLICCVRFTRDILLRRELRTLAESWNFTVRTYISSGETDSGSKHYGEDLVFARLDIKALSREIDPESTPTLLVLICGTQGFNADMRGNVLALGVDESNIHVF